MKKFLLLLFPLLSILIISGQPKFIVTGKYRQHVARAISYYEQKKFRQAGMSYDSLFKITAEKCLASDKYNAACSWALAGNKEKAFYYLNRVAIVDKWDKLSLLISDKDLFVLHADKRWPSILKTVATNKEKAEAKLNKPLISLLDTIWKKDQNDRLKLDSIQQLFGLHSSQLDSLWKKINYQDSVNLVKVKHIIDKYGWLGDDEIGENGASAIFLVIQHSDSLTQVSYAPKMREAVKKGKANAADLALLEDRILIRQGKEQIYGSQLFQDNQTGEIKFFPIVEEWNVNKRREAVGLRPIEEYAKLFGLEYVLPRRSVKQLKENR